MADNQEEEVLYQFTGDVSSLRKATEAAIGFLGNYQAQIDRISADGGFGKSAKAAKSFSSQVSALSKQMLGIQKQMKGVSDVRLFPSSVVTQQLQSTLGSIHQVFNALDSSATLSTKEVRALGAQLRSTNASLKSHSADVTALIQKEQQWQGTLDKVRSKTTQFRDGLDSLKGRVTGVLDPMLAKLRSLSSPFTKVATNVQTFKDKASESFGRVSQLASTVVAALRRVSTTEDAAANAASRSTNAHLKLFGGLSRAQHAFKQELKAITQEKDALEKKNDTLKNSSRRHTSLRDILILLGNSFRLESNSLRIFNTNLNNVQRSSRALKGALAGLVSVPIAQWLAEAAKQSINYTENVNLFTVAMGDSLEVGREFVAQMAEIYGMDPSNLMRYAGNFYQLADAIDMSDAAASNISLSLLKATNDISSLFNVPIETVFNDLSSGMQGMSRAVRKYGMDIRVTTLQQTALSLGITEQVENMSEANRQGLRFITMMRQASNASGDFARTIESPANQLKIFKEQITQLGRAIGDLFIDRLAAAMQYINGFVMSLRMVISFIGSVLGLVNSVTGDAAESSDEAAQSISNIGAAAGGAAKKLKAMLAPFDELNVLKEPDTSSGGGSLDTSDVLDPAIASAIANMELKLEDIRMKALDVRDTILEFLGFTIDGNQIISWDASVLEANLIDKFPQWTKTIQAVFDNWSGIVEGFKAVIKSLGTVARTVLEKLFDFIQQFVNDDSVSRFLGNMVTHLQNLSSWIEQHADGLANLVIALGAFRVLASLVTPISNLISGLSSFGNLIANVWPVISGISASTLGWVAALVAVGVALVDQWKNNEEFRDRIGEVWNTISSSIGTVIGQIVRIISSLWQDILQPLLGWLITALGPSIADIVAGILEIVAWMVDNLGGLISGLLQVIQGIIDFIAGVFTGDWTRAWNGIVDVFAGLFNAVGTVVVSVMNVVISVINGAISAVYNAVVSVINLVLEAVNSIAGVIGFTLELGINAQAPQIPYFQAPRVAMATGGVVTSPTNALIGEGRYDEAVMPLGNSPQMRQFADSVADRVNSGEQIALLREQNALLRQILDKTGVSIDGRALTDEVTNRQRNRSRALGG